ncbi:MAG: hypothetical protein JHC31_10725 [Sulfurihydrogenibium sp.]|nr:hypothetical protein [Sulfurihydrogenibium sp.]
MKKIDIRKRKVIISLLCDPVILKKFDKISDETNIPRTKLIEASMIKTINDYKNGNTEVIEIAKKLKRGYKEFQKEEEP